MQLPDYILQKAKASRARIVLPEAHDPRIIQAACIATEQNLAQIILLGTPDHINRSAHNQGLTLDGISVIDPKTSPLSNQYAELLVTNSLKARITLEKALQRIQTSIVFANCMVANNEAEGCVAGATMSTAEVIRHAIRIVGQNSANAVVSSFFLMIFDSTNPGIQGPVLFADCGLINDPDANKPGCCRQFRCQADSVHQGAGRLEAQVRLGRRSNSGIGQRGDPAWKGKEGRDSPRGYRAHRQGNPARRRHGNSF